MEKQNKEKIKMLGQVILKYFLNFIFLKFKENLDDIKKEKWVKHISVI